MSKIQKKGVSGIMRIRNEKDFIEPCIESCISVLDELVIVYNDCTDGSEEVIERIRMEYPDKIKVFNYPYKVLGVGLTKEEYEYAKSLPADSPQLLCNYYNFALSKVSYQYAIKIDADQMYFSDVLEEYCDLCREDAHRFRKSHIYLGKLFQSYLSLFRYLSMRSNKLLPFMPNWLGKYAATYYKAYAKKLFIDGKACLSFSGINVVEDKGDTYVCMGLKSDEFNILPPFNGEGDHVLFKVSEDTYYQPFDMSYYKKLRNTTYSLIEIFIHPYRIMPVGYAQRKEYINRVLEVKKRRPEAFVKIADFLKSGYNQILRQTDPAMFNHFQRVLFAYVYKAYGHTIVKHIQK